MIRRYLYIILFLLMVGVTGCYTDFEPDIESTPVVCLNSRIIAGEAITAHVSRTWRYSEGYNGLNFGIYLEDADVDLYVNDKFKERMEFTIGRKGFYYYEPDSMFVAQYVPSYGDKIRLHVTDKTYGEAEATVTVPYPVAIDNVVTNITSNDVTLDEDNNSFGSKFEMILSVTFTDPADAINAYLLDIPTFRGYESSVDDRHKYSESMRVNPDYSFEPILSEHISPVETVITDAYGLYTMFSDRQISGRPYTLKIPLEGSYYCNYGLLTEPAPTLTMDVHLAHISADYYNFMLSLWAATEGISGALGDVGLGDAVFEHSNVSTGAGIVTTQADAVFSIPLHDLLSQQ